MTTFEDFRSDPEQYLNQKNVGGETRSKIEEWLHTENALAKQQAELTEQKNITSGKFRSADKEQREALKSEMRDITQSLTSIENKLGNVTDELKKVLLAAGLVSPPSATKKNTEEEQLEQSESATSSPELTRYAGTPCSSWKVSTADSQQCEPWNNYVERHNAGRFYHRMDVVERVALTLGHQAHFWLAKNEANEVLGLLPLIHIRSRLFGSYGVSVPWFNYGGAIGDSADIEHALMEASKALLTIGDKPAEHIEFRDIIKHDEWPCVSHKVCMQLPLPSSYEQLWDGFTSKLRAQIRRPEREAIETKIGGEELLDDFYRVFAENMRDLGTPVYGKDVFRVLLNNWPGHCELVVLYWQGKAVSCAFLITYQNRTEIPWASTLSMANGISANMLLYARVLNHAIQRGSKIFDFGRSSPDAGTYKFKAQWGAKPVPNYWHYALAEGAELPSLNPNNPKFALVISVWKKLPVALTKLLGPHIVRNLP